MTWNVPAALHAELDGDPGPWHRYVKTAWRASITKTRDVALPKAPPAGYLTEPSTDAHAKVISYWAPLFDLLVFGLGWSRPDVGLLRWRELGFPQNDPILRTVLRWWGEGGVTDVLAWAQARDGFGTLAGWFGDVVGVPLRTSGFPNWPGNDELLVHRETTEWKAIWGGGGDPHHLLNHAQVAAEDGHASLNAQRYDNNFFQVGAVLIVDHYAGWYLPLIHEFKDGVQPVDVVVKPIGWLGTFQRSPESGLWHRTDEGTHLMGRWS